MPRPATKRALVEAFDERLRRVDQALHAAQKDPSERASHRLRTSTRRLEATLSILPKQVRSRGPWARYVRRAKVLFKAHGAVRDLDVLAKRLSAYPECAALVRRIRSERARARAHALGLGAQELAAPPPLEADAVSGRAVRARLDDRGEALRARLGRELRRTRKHAAVDEHAHDARKTAKQLRYVLEALDEQAFREALGALEALQDLLGAMHDAAVARDRLRAEHDEALARATRAEERSRLALHVELPAAWRAVRQALARDAR